jgi:hypothetical protein
MLSRTYKFLSQYNIIRYHYLINRQNIQSYYDNDLKDGFNNNFKEYLNPSECVRCKINRPIYDKVGIGKLTHCIEC